MLQETAYPKSSVSLTKLILRRGLSRGVDKTRIGPDRTGPDHGSDHKSDHKSDHGSDQGKKLSFKEKKSRKIKSFIR